VWYCNLPTTSSLHSQILTDINGHQHNNTVPAGLVNPNLWQQHLATHLAGLAAPFAEAISTRHPFITKVNDALCDRAVFFNGKVILVGDAFATFRPHFAVATEQAARHCLGLGRVWGGEMTLQEWEEEAKTWGKTQWLRGRILGAFGTGRWWEFVKGLWKYVAFVVGLKVRGINFQGLGGQH
jgi:hypothetical protein